MNVGFMGLGSMGMKMAQNLIKAGFEVTGYNRTRSKEGALAAAGGKRVETLAEMGKTCDVIVTCLPTDAVVCDALFGREGLLDSAAPRFKYLIDCSTIDVTAARELGQELLERGVYYFDSPVSGGPKGAEDGTLTIMVGGDERVLREVLMPVYRAMGKNILYFGENGSAQKVKLINQILTWVNHAVICEAAALAKRAGLDEDKMYECLLTSFGYSRVLEVTYKSHIQPENYENPTGMAMMVKDLSLAQKFAKAYGAKLPMTDASMTLYQKAVEDGYGNCDQSVILKQLL
ncbi:MAG: NAD(P)-dependent oxidoreductase [Clostridia bacterium]|nr:NAD(P)-dependent oxidoreductase [Clostridia bacterium]